MTEFRQPITKPPLPEFKDPKLVEAALAMEEYFDTVEAEVQTAKILGEAGDTYTERADQVDGLSCELLTNPEMVTALSTIGEYASKMITGEARKELEDAYAPSLSMRLGRPRVTMPNSELSCALADASARPELVPPALQYALDTVWAEAVSERGTEPSPSITVAEVKDALSRAKKLSDVASSEPEVQTPGEKVEYARHMAAVIDDLPSERTFNVITGLAYFDTLREFTKKNAGVKNGILGDELRHKMLGGGVPIQAVIQAEASILLDFAGAVKEGSLALANTLRFAKMADALGVKPRKVAGTGNTLRTDKLSEHQAVVVNAHNVMLEVHAHAEAAAFTLNRLLPVLLQRKVVKKIPELLAETIDDFYAEVEEASAYDLDEEYEQQLHQLEQYKNDRVRQIRTELKDPGMLNYDQLKPLDAALEPRLQNLIGSRVLGEQLGALREFIDNKIAEVAPLDAPYAYTSKKIRSYENGPNLIRDLETSLDKRGLTPSVEILQTLAILINQAETAEDKAAYFDKLAQARNQIEAHMAELDFVGARDEYTSPTANALRWIDEIIDAGKEGQVNNTRLMRFIQDYYLGPEPETFEEPAPEAPEEAPIEDVLPTEETHEVPEDNDTTEEEEPTPSDEPTPLERYVTTLQDILGNIEIHRANVAVFPPGKTERQRQQREAREENHFIDVDPERLQNLVRLKQSLEVEGKVATLMYTQPTSWSALPHFALYVQQSPEAGTGVCLLENPVNGNASYVFTVDGELVMDWEELARVTKQEARDLGAATFVHPTKGASNFDQHYSGKLKSHIALELASLR